MMKALAELGRHLPRVAEEGADNETVAETTLIGKIAGIAGGQERAEVLVARSGGCSSHFRCWTRRLSSGEPGEWSPSRPCCAPAVC